MRNKNNSALLGAESFLLKILEMEAGRTRCALPVLVLRAVARESPQMSVGAICFTGFAVSFGLGGRAVYEAGLVCVHAHRFSPTCVLYRRLSQTFGSCGESLSCIILYHV